MDTPNIDLLNKIREAMPEWRVDLKDPTNAFTVWAEMSNGSVNFCGGAETLEVAQVLASKHLNIEKLYIVRANPPGIIPFENPPTAVL